MSHLSLFWFSCPSRRNASCTRHTRSANGKSPFFHITATELRHWIFSVLQFSFFLHPRFPLLPPPSYESLATLYEILLTLDSIERLYLRDGISSEAYTEQCKKLLNSYKVGLENKRLDFWK